MRRGISTGTVTLALIVAMSGTSSFVTAGYGDEVAPVCSHALPAGTAGCHAIQLLNPSANWHGLHAPGSDSGTRPGRGPSGKGPGGSFLSTFPGYFPAELQAAYGLATASTQQGTGQTVAIVDAYDDPNAEADLAVYRTRFGLPQCAASNGCFAKVNQSGEKANYPTGNTSWSQEISLDIDMVSAICPHCKILLVEAKSATFANLGAAEEVATSNAQVVSNSYGGSEFSSERSYDHYYDHPGVAITASSGDEGYRVEYPAASPFVTAVGGTTLSKGSTSNTRAWSETVWSGAGSGCSALEPNPGWQPLTSLCATRTVADAAADANPNTGVAVFDSYGTSGWLVFGGTSVSSPIVASVYALAGNASSFTVSSSGSDGAQALYSLSAPPALNKVTSGSNARRCSVYLCNAVDSLNAFDGYNGPTGEGTPNGVAGF